MDSSRFEFESQGIRDELKLLRQSINELSIDIAMSQKTSNALGPREGLAQTASSNGLKSNWGVKDFEAIDTTEASPAKRNPWAARLDYSQADNSKVHASAFKSSDDELNYATQAKPDRCTPLMNLCKTVSTSRLKLYSDENSKPATEMERQLASEIASLK